MTLEKVYAFLNHAKEEDPGNVISLIESSMSGICLPVANTASADVIFVHFPTHRLERALGNLVLNGTVGVGSTLVLCSSHPYGMESMLKSFTNFPDRHVLRDPAMFQRVVGEFMAGLAAGKVRTDLLASRAPPEALVGLYLLLKGGMDDGSIESYRAANVERLRSEARIYLDEGITIETIDPNALSDALTHAFER